MADRDLLQGIQDEIRLSRELHAQTMAVIAETRQHNDSVLATYREFTREIVARIQRIGREEIRELQRFRGRDAALWRGAAESRGEIRDLREESRALREALLRLVDRLGPGGAPA